MRSYNLFVLEALAHARHQALLEEAAHVQLISVPTAPAAGDQRQWPAILTERISAVLPWATHQAERGESSAARIHRRGALRLGMAGMAVTLADVMTTNLSPVAAQPTDPDGVQLGEIYQLQAAFHQAKSHQDIDLMMSLWSPDASFTFNGDVFSGADAIRAFFLGSGSWKYRRMSLVPSFKDQIRLDGDQAYLYFECHDVALTDESAAVPAGTVVTHLTNFGTIRNLNGAWMFQTMYFGSATPLSVDAIYDQ
jgi:ketosteroid isomerase-like protein